MRLSIEQIYQAALTAGFTPDQATTWTAIALAESGGETGALNDVGEHSVGLWQVNLDAHENTWGDLHDPVAAARAAYEISRQGTDMRPWTVTHASNAGTARDYRSYLPQVSAFTGYAGDGRGVEGYGAPLPEPLPPSGPAVPTGFDQVTATMPGTEPAVDLLSDPRSKVDTDADGLTDAFEAMVGSDPTLADTDSEGLSDAYEVVVTHTDVRSADTDQDTMTDATEVALGTSGSAWDTDLDGASDGVEVQFGKDPLVADREPLPQQPVEVAPAAPAQPVSTSATTTTAPGTMGTAGTTEGATGTTDGGTLADMFVELARQQTGDEYVFGAEASLDDADPETFDCSELTQWAADQVGVTIPDGAMYQYLELKQEGQLMSVEEALRTKGALLFYFSEEPTPGGSRPGSAHVAISLGDGRTIEARGSSYGVNEFDATGRFNYAGVIPELAGTAPATGTMTLPTVTEPVASTADPDSDDDGLSDAFERMLGLDPLSSDSDDDGVSDAEEQLGEATQLTPAEVRAALEKQGLQPTDDADQDGLSNRYEIRHRLDATKLDTDSDGMTDSTEVALGTDPLRLDTDADGLTDRIELELGTDPLTAGNPTDGWGLPVDEELPDPATVAPSTGAVDDLGDL